jgi:hypothetical protein
VNEVKRLLEKATAFQKAAHAILAVHEASTSRVIVLSESYEKLSKLSIKQDELFRQALRCVEQELYRAAHVLAWAGFMDFLEEKLASDGLVKLRAMYTSWAASSLDELRENVVEYQLIVAANKLGLCSRAEMKAFHGMLSKRNECAHPSDYYPDINGSLGYISELMSRIATLQPKTL